MKTKLHEGMVLQHKVDAEFIVELLRKGEEDRDTWTCKILKGERSIYARGSTQVIWDEHIDGPAFWLTPLTEVKLDKFFKELKLGKELYT